MSASAQSSTPPTIVPPAALIAAGTLIAFAIVVALLGHLTGAATPMPTTVSLVSEELRFVDQRSGAIEALDAHDGHVAGIIAPGQDGFLRALLFGLGNARRQRGIGPDTPFRLTMWRDGRLTFDDLGTGIRLDLEAFGPTNAATFVRLLPQPSAQP